MRSRTVPRRASSGSSSPATARRELDRILDESSQLSFPASDPPAYMGSVAIPGCTPQASRRAAEKEAVSAHAPTRLTGPFGRHPR